MLLTCVLHALLSPVDSTGAVEDKQNHIEFLLTCRFAPCVSRLSCV